MSTTYRPASADCFCERSELCCVQLHAFVGQYFDSTLAFAYNESECQTSKYRSSDAIHDDLSLCRAF